MTPQDALDEVIRRVAAARGQAVYLTAHELADWPSVAVEALQSVEVLIKAPPASSAVCPGCERECVMPVHALPGTPHSTPPPFIVCDKRDDVNRVAVPPACLEQWRTSGASIASFIADGLGLPRPIGGQASGRRWEVGLYRGSKHAAHVVLVAEDDLEVTAAGHSVSVMELIRMKDGRPALDVVRVRRLVDRPVAAAGDEESAESRRQRFVGRVDELKAQGVRAFLKTLAQEEGISESRVKQILARAPQRRG